MKPNLLIRASAGTGKTFSLATRFIQLLLLEDARPEAILALTFSRAAAQEIYAKLLERLWTAAASDENAAREKETLLAKMDAAERARAEAKNPDWSRGRFASLLAQIVAAQHYGSIATLDSFILRIVRSFPLEMGFQHAVDVLDAFGERQALAESQRAYLSGEDPTHAFEEAYAVLTRGAFARTCSTAVGHALRDWRNFLVDHPSCRSWRVPSLCAALGIPEHPERPSVEAIPDTGKRADPLAGILARYRAFTGDEPVFGEKKNGAYPKWSELMQHLLRHPEATSYAYGTPSGKEKTIACTPACAEAVRAVARYMLNVKLLRAVEKVCAGIRLCACVEETYDATTRRRGLLTFSDFTNCQARLERDPEEALKLDNLRFRFDTRYDHWALDEFQDTSRLQWHCLRPLVAEAAQPVPGRSVMVVGDLKQSIYAWRGGDEGPFKELMSWGAFSGPYGEIVPNDVSFRYGRNTADFVNAVFGPGNIRVGDVLGAAEQPAIDRWLAEDCWMNHRAAAKNGTVNDGDYVAVLAVKKPEDAPDGAEAFDGEDDDADRGGAAMKILAPAVCACVADLWQRHEAVGSDETVGILVRDNRDGLALAERLRAWGDGRLPVVWEGSDGVCDAPAVRAVLELLKLAEHPEDTFAWKTVETVFGVRQTVFPNLTRVGSVSVEVSRMLTAYGLARTLGTIVSRLLAPSAPAPDARSAARLRALVRAGEAYERRRDAANGVLAFVDYLVSTAGREIASSPHVIRILTIHRSKGLTLDRVIVPILEAEGSSIVKPRKGAPLADDDGAWALAAPPEIEASFNERIRAAWNKAACEGLLEQLRLNYVALTRARKSTHVFICDAPRGANVHFRDLLRAPFASAPADESPYGTRVCTFGQMPPFTPSKDGQKTRVSPTDSLKTEKNNEKQNILEHFSGPVPGKWVHKAGRGAVIRRTPSAVAGAAYRPKGSVESFFSAEAGLAAEKGTSAHARYAAIGWIDPANPQNDVERWIVASGWAPAFVRGDATALWREQPYECFRDGVWESGQFDRVVFRGTGADRSAVIYDFKTNARGADETEGAFAERMCRTYASQMTDYRRSLARLTGIPDTRIGTVLLLRATGQSVAG